jgi:hypothetical protein
MAEELDGRGRDEPREKPEALIDAFTSDHARLLADSP